MLSQLAIKRENLEMVKKLLPLCKLTHLDNNNNSIFHYAALTTKEILNVSVFYIFFFLSSKLIEFNVLCYAIYTFSIPFPFLFGFRLQLLAAEKIENVNVVNSEGQTALHLACLYDKPDCVKALLSAGADANIQSGRTGNGPSK